MRSSLLRARLSPSSLLQIPKRLLKGSTRGQPSRSQRSALPKTRTEPTRTPLILLTAPPVPKLCRGARNLLALWQKTGRILPHGQQLKHRFWGC